MVEELMKAELAGEVISWEAKGCSYKQLTKALRDNSLDEGVARELLPRFAFSRAIKKLGKDRIIRRVDEGKTTIYFQFTREYLSEGRYSYAFETLLELNKLTGHIECEQPDLRDMARVLLAESIAARTGSDVTRTVQKLFDRNADLFPIRPKGGVYFVPNTYQSFTHQVEGFLTAVGGTMMRFPVPKGTARGDVSVRRSVAAGLEHLIAEHRKAAEAITDDTRDSTFARRVEEFRITKLKIEAYADYLGEERLRLEETLREAEDVLHRSLEAVPA